MKGGAVLAAQVVAEENHVGVSADCVEPAVEPGEVVLRKRLDEATATLRVERHVSEVVVYSVQELRNL